MGKVIDMMTREVLADDDAEFQLRDLQLTCASIRTQLRERRAKVAEAERIISSNAVYIDDDMEARRRLPRERNLARSAIQALEAELIEVHAKIGVLYDRGVHSKFDGSENFAIEVSRDQ